MAYKIIILPVDDGHNLSVDSVLRREEDPGQEHLPKKGPIQTVIKASDDQMNGILGHLYAIKHGYDTFGIEQAVSVTLS